MVCAVLWLGQWEFDHYISPYAFLGCMPDTPAMVPYNFGNNIKPQAGAFTDVLGSEKGLSQPF